MIRLLNHQWEITLYNQTLTLLTPRNPGTSRYHTTFGRFIVFDKLLLVGITLPSTEAMSDRSSTSPDVPWVVEHGWIKSSIENPSGVQLDDVPADYPVALLDSAGHSLLVIQGDGVGRHR